jgi:uncharacterized cupredoxin-like copper-binding protein
MDPSRHIRRSALLSIAAGLTTVSCASPGRTPTAQQIVVRASEFSFGPTKIEVLAGQPVKITLQNTGLIDHDWVVRDLRDESGHSAGSDHGPDSPVHVHAKAGQRASVQFTTKQAGTYRVVCTEPGHEQAGMVGQLIVRA